MIILGFAFNTFTANPITLPGEVPVVSGDLNVDKCWNAAFKAWKGQNILNIESSENKIPVWKHDCEWVKGRTS